jgi:hypothetical protein
MKPHVLILEDSFIISMDIENLVTENLKATPVLARSVRAALKLLPDHIAFAFLDINVVDGEIPFIFLSGKNKNLLPDAFSQAPFLSKPFDAENLLHLTKSLTGAFE